MSTDALLTMFLLAGVAAAAGLVGIWAAVSERHWFWRAVGVWGCVAVLVPIRVWEPAMVFAVALPMAVLMIWAARGVRIWHGAVGGSRNAAEGVPYRMRELGGARNDEEGVSSASASRNAAEGVPYRWVRFGLLDVFLLMLLVGLWLLVVRQIARAAVDVKVYEIVAPAIVMAALTASGWWLVRGPRRIIPGAFAVLMVPLGAWLLWPHKNEWVTGATWIYSLESLGFNNLGSFFGGQRTWFRGFRMNCLALKPLASRPVGRIKACVAAAVVLGFTWFCWQLIALTPYPPAFGTTGNRAARILEIAERTQVLNPPNAAFEVSAASSQSLDTNRELNRLYEEALEALRATNSLPFDPEKDSTLAFFDDAVRDRHNAMRHLIKCLLAEMEEAVAKNDRQRAMAMSLGQIRLGTMSCRNSLSMECQVGHSFMQVPFKHFIVSRESFTPEEHAEIKAALDRAEAEHEPLELIRQRDLAISERVRGWQVRFSQLVTGGRDDDDNNRVAMGRTYDRWIAISRLLVTDLAIRKYQREHRAWPHSLADLTPNYLEKPPIDPYTGVQLVYRAGGEGFLLYSAGWDRVDNGGRLGSASAFYKEGFDLDLDMFTRPQGTVVEPKVRGEADGELGEKHEDAKGTKGEGRGD